MENYNKNPKMENTKLQNIKQMKQKISIIKTLFYKLRDRIKKKSNIKEK